MENSFEIRVGKWGESRKYIMKVEVVYQSEQVIRFKITAGGREMDMEKLLLKKTNQWKLTATNFKLDGNPQAIAGAILNIQKEIEYKLNPKTPKQWN
jgi:hypothetical protein